MTSYNSFNSFELELCGYSKKKKFGLKVLVLKNRTTAKMFKARERATIKFTSLGAWTARVYLCLRFYLAVDLV